MFQKLHLVLLVILAVVTSALATQDMDLDYDTIRAIEPSG